MPYEVLVKEAYSLIDEIPMEKLPYVVDFLRSANALYEVKSVRCSWEREFSRMHENKDDVLEEIPESGDFEWEW